MEFSEIKYYVALIRQIKKPIVVKKAHETYNFNQEKHVVTVCSSNSWTQLMSTLQIFPFFLNFHSKRSFLFSSNCLQIETTFVHVLFEKARGYFVCHITVCGSSSKHVRLLILKNVWCNFIFYVIKECLWRFSFASKWNSQSNLPEYNIFFKYKFIYEL